MAKLSFSKLGLNKTKIQEIKEVAYNEQNIEIKQYLDMETKFEMMNYIVNNTIASSENSFKNGMHLEIYTNLAIVFYYTNLNFTEKQKEDVIKLYDLLESNGFFNFIISNIPETEYNFIITFVEELLTSFYNYKNSALGILETISQDYDQTSLSLDEISAKIADPNSLEMVKNVISKLV